MDVVTTIQVSARENREIQELKDELGLSSKKAVVIEGIRTLREILSKQKRRRRLQEASRLVKGGSMETNEEWSPLSSALNQP